ncbi:unnamed protein product [Citrullus colocynthis]|uniref:Uncharacterized protein n=1 Tax=Citrullus colocynthis TaxID=252529 RepID=A0ABP0XSZ6_9ROSI
MKYLNQKSERQTAIATTEAVIPVVVDLRRPRGESNHKRREFNNESIEGGPILVVSMPLPPLAGRNNAAVTAPQLRLLFVK